MFLPPDVLEWALNVVVVRSGGRTILVDAGIGAEFPDLKRAGRLVRRLDDAGIDLIRDRRGADSPAHGPHRRLAHRRGEGATASGSAVHVEASEVKFWDESPDFSRVSMPPGFPDALRRLSLGTGSLGVLTA